jgi:hypothetical protein
MVAQNLKGRCLVKERGCQGEPHDLRTDPGGVSHGDRDVNARIN